MKKPELLAPAGSFEKAKTAFTYGADAIYVGTSNLSLRTRVDMDDNELKKIIDYAHSINKKVYVASFLRLIVIPAVIMIALKFIGANDDLMTLALIAFATPLGLNTIVYPAAYGGETKTGASMAMVSHALSVITIPVMYLIFIVYL